MFLFRGGNIRQFLQRPHARWIIRHLVVVGQSLRISVARVQARVIAPLEQQDGYDGARFPLPDDPDVGRLKQPLDALRASEFDESGTSRHRHMTRTGTKHNYCEAG